MPGGSAGAAAGGGGRGSSSSSGRTSNAIGHASAACELSCNSGTKALIIILIIVLTLIAILAVCCCVAKGGYGGGTSPKDLRTWKWNVKTGRWEDVEKWSGGATPGRLDGGAGDGSRNLNRTDIDGVHGLDNDVQETSVNVEKQKQWKWNLKTGRYEEVEPKSGVVERGEDATDIRVEQRGSDAREGPEAGEVERGDLSDGDARQRDAGMRTFYKKASEEDLVAVPKKPLPAATRCERGSE